VAEIVWIKFMNALHGVFKLSGPAALGRGNKPPQKVALLTSIPT
jgi:hypothetical protein